MQGNWLLSVVASVLLVSSVPPGGAFQGRVHVSGVWELLKSMDRLCPFCKRVQEANYMVVESSD